VELQTPKVGMRARPARARRGNSTKEEKQMTRNRKVMGLTLALFALGAVMASAASASGFEDPNKVKEVLTAEGETTFSTKVKPETKVTCSGKYSGTENLPSLTITLRPTFSECAGGGVTKVDTTGCGMIFYSETTKHPRTEGKEEETDSPVEFDCEAGKSIIITSTICNITIPAPGGERFHGAVYDNEGAGATRDVKITVTMDKIKYTTPETLGCNLAGLPRKGEDGTLTTTAGKGITMKGYEDLCEEVGGKDVECPFAPTEGANKDTYTDGKEIGVEWTGGP
jgi:hypothetical protein